MMTQLQREIEDQKKYYTVITSPPCGRAIKTTKELITVEKCKNIVNNIENLTKIKISTITIMMTQYDYAALSDSDYEHVLSGDCGVERVGAEKCATYDVRANCLRIWESGLPIYENNNGVICRDADALADCLL